MYQTLTIPDLSAMETFGHQLVQSLQKIYNSDHACVICLNGNLGAGKTTLTQIIARHLGVTETVQSPTFVIKKTYTTIHPVFTHLVHIDAYRLDDPQTNKQIFAFEQDFSRIGNMVIIEWSEMIADSIPDSALIITINHENQGRSIQIPSEIILQ